MKWKMFIFYIKQLFPCLYWSYGTMLKDDGTDEYNVVQIFRMWFGRVLWVKQWKAEPMAAPERKK